MELLHYRMTDGRFSVKGDQEKEFLVETLAKRLRENEIDEQEAAAVRAAEEAAAEAARKEKEASMINVLGGDECKELKDRPYSRTTKNSMMRRSK